MEMTFRDILSLVVSVALALGGVTAIFELTSLGKQTPNRNPEQEEWALEPVTIK